MSQYVFISYIFKCEICQDEQGVRAAKAQCLTVDTLFSNITDDLELSTNITTKATVRAKNCSLKHL